MISFIAADWEMYGEWRGLSTDTKPTSNVENGATFYEMDTKAMYMYDKEHTTWLKQ